MPEAGARKRVMPPMQGKVPRFVCGVITCIIVVVGLVVLIAWLSLQPHKPKYYLEYGSASFLKVSDDGMVSAKMQFNLTTRNSNKKIGIYYDRIAVMMSYDGDYFAWGSMLPFYQHHKNTTYLHTNLYGEMVNLQGAKSHDLRLEHSSGKVDLVLEVYASVRFKVGSWKSGHYTLRVKCRNAKLDVTNGTFQRTKCKVKV
ncbi:hypothetical protein SUGI_0827520 [Cryptomeria japonica]|uniref:NDR1/HIN1-like protein 10 n=1 Tax=Cryptomeria japonica TaxID=3369 RepID=UPI002414B425|nr:NDR1/HIN1-like protein 10 [Cryptomeria japonica]GLJ40280.1 hypothetical protein SUGI_0827520 [Cryptomeria japonica]